jgi:hypothetical protein
MNIKKTLMVSKLQPITYCKQHNIFHILIYGSIHCHTIYNGCSCKYCAIILVEICQNKYKSLMDICLNLERTYLFTYLFSLPILGYLLPYLPLLCKSIITTHMALKLNLWLGIAYMAHLGLT